MGRDIPADLESTIADLLHDVARLTRRAVGDELAPLGITNAQLRALRALARSRDPLRMGEVADRLGIVPRSATSVVDDLEAAGLVARTADATDRRAHRVGLTDHGRDVLERVRRRRQTAARRLLADRLDRADQVELHRLLTRLADPDAP